MFERWQTLIIMLNMFVAIPTQEPVIKWMSLAAFLLMIVFVDIEMAA